jgi:hypothetical protein
LRFCGKVIAEQVVKSKSLERSWFMLAEEHQSVRADILFQLDVLTLQLEHERKVAVYGSYFSAGASFEVFSLTLAITGLLLEKGLPFYWIILVFVYFLTGASFIAYSLFGFGKQKKTERNRLDELMKKYA